MRAALLLVLVLGGSVSVSVAERVRGVATVFDLGDQGAVILPVTVNGRGPFRFLLDTGSTHSAISEDLAAEIGAPVVARTVIGSVAGSRAVLVARIDDLRCGPIVARGLLTSIVDVDQVGGADGIQGIIGQDALTPLRYTIDFRQRHVVWWPEGGAVARGTAFDLEADNGRFLASFPQPRSVLRLVPDSGASSLLLFDGQPQLALTLLPDNARLTTTSAQGTVRMARVRELHIGRTLLRDVAAVVIGRDTSEPPGTDGLLPLHLFDRVTFDGPRRLLILEGRLGAG